MSHTILLVDNDMASRRLLENTVSKKLGYHVVVAASAQEAIERVTRGHMPLVDVVLIDMAMSVSAAIKVISALKLYKPELPIIIMTDYGNHDSATAAIAAGANDFLVKPLAIERLGLSLANAVRVYQLHHTIKQLQQRLSDDGIEVPNARANIMRMATLVDDNGKVKKLRLLEEEAIRNALEACDGSMTQAARSLGIGRSTLYRKVSELERYSTTIMSHSAYISRANQITRPMMEVSSADRS